MATQLFLLDAAADTHLGTNNTNLRGSSIGWDQRALGTARGSGVSISSTNSTVTGATPGVEVSFFGGTTPSSCWISPPLSADVTIAGTITLNIWASESNMSANVAINAVIEVIRANVLGTANSNTLVEIARSTRTTEVAIGTRAVNNFTVTPTSTVVNRGDRLRVRIFGDDVGTMATGYTFDASWNGATASADGDTYVTFTENFSFDNPPGPLDQSNHPNTVGIGAVAATTKAAQAFVAQGTLTEVRAWLKKTGSPTDDLVIEVQSDSGGDPSGTVISTVATVAATSLTGTEAQYTYPVSIALTSGTKYWLVFSRSGGIDVSNASQVQSGDTAGWMLVRNWTGSAWGNALTGSLSVRLEFSPTSTLYLTNTASDVVTASTDLEAWTSRGSSALSSLRACVAGWTAPLQMQVSSVVVDWFTKQLAAFTLTGMAVANLSIAEGNSSSNCSARCEIARVDSDGTNPTVWASWCIAPTGTDNGELATTFTVARTAYVSGDDLAFTDGQRIRIRIYTDDISSAAMGAVSSGDLRYSGPTPAATGDTYITLPQTVTEYSPGGGAPGPASSRRQRRASRYLTFR